MTRNEILQTLKTHQNDLAQLGIKSLSIFGSAARNEARVGSDIDVLVEFSRPVGIFHFLDVKDRLETILGCRVDLVTEKALKRQLRDRILKEAVHAL